MKLKYNIFWLIYLQKANFHQCRYSRCSETWYAAGLWLDDLYRFICSYDIYIIWTRYKTALYFSIISDFTISLQLKLEDRFSKLKIVSLVDVWTNLDVHSTSRFFAYIRQGDPLRTIFGRYRELVNTFILSLLQLTREMQHCMLDGFSVHHLTIGLSQMHQMWSEDWGRIQDRI